MAEGLSRSIMLRSIAGEPAPDADNGRPEFAEAFEIGQAGHETFVEGHGQDDQIRRR